MSEMESSQCSSVPYSLSDIQLPQSPGDVSSKTLTSEENPNEGKSKKKAESMKVKPNGVPTKEYSPVDLPSDSKKIKKRDKNIEENKKAKNITVDCEQSKLGSNEELETSKSHTEEITTSNEDFPKVSEGFYDSKNQVPKSLQSDEDQGHSEKDKVRHRRSKSKSNTKLKHKHASEVKKSKHIKDSRPSASDNESKSSDSDVESKQTDLKTKLKKLKQNNQDAEKGLRRKTSYSPIKEPESSESDNQYNQADSRHKSLNLAASCKHPESRRELSNSSDTEGSQVSIPEQESQSSTRKKSSPLRRSSSSSRSDSSSYGKHKKILKNKEKDELSVQSEVDKSTQLVDAKSDKIATEITINPEPVPNHSDTPKKRIKIKRDNIPVEINSKTEVSENSTLISNTEVSSSPVTAAKSGTIEGDESLHDLPYVSRKVSLSNRKFSRLPSDDSEPKQKKSKWGSYASKKASETISISTDSLKNWFPDFKLISEPATSMEVESEDNNLSVSEDKPVQPDANDENESSSKHTFSTYMEAEDTESQETIVKETAEQGHVSKMIFIQNLVRPFTLNQLKNLLRQNGNFVEETFWIDKIKSKCFVTYETEKEAIKAKNALHNTRWPASNPKILAVEFSNEEELELHKKGNEHPPKSAQEAVVQPTETSKAKDPSSADEKRKDRDRHRERERKKAQPSVREWDKDKIVQESPEREPMKKEEKRSSEKKEKKDSKKRASEDTSAKLLDDLFQKTKSTPCIYWLPLTEEQVQQKEEAKKLRKLEREKRIQEIKEQEESNRRNRRARSPRRSREKENRKSSTRSRTPVTRRR